MVIGPKLKGLKKLHRLFTKKIKALWRITKENIVVIITILASICTLTGVNLRIGLPTEFLLTTCFIVLFVVYLNERQNDVTVAKLYAKSFNDIAEKIRCITYKNIKETHDQNTPGEIKENLKSYFDSICDILYDTIEKRGLKIEAVTIKFILNERLIRIGRNKEAKGRNSSQYEHRDNSPFFTFLSHASFSYKRVCAREDNEFKSISTNHQFFAMQDIIELSKSPPEIIFRIMDTDPRTDLFAKGIFDAQIRECCQEISTRAGNCYSACMAMPIQPYNPHNANTATDDFMSLPGFIGIDSNEKYIWDKLSIDLINFLAATADLLHDVIIPKIEAFNPANNNIT